jgi:hypothetical protein
MEAASAIGGDCLEIASDVHELDEAVKGIGSPAVAPSEAAPARDQRGVKAAIAEMEGAVRKLEDGGGVLREFAEETNGVALNIALMAARGNVPEQELAHFAEKVRGTAERFNRLCSTVSSLAQSLLQGCHSLKEAAGENAPAAQPASAEARDAVRAIARRLDDRTGQLQKRMCNIGSDLHDIRDLLQKALASLDAGGARGAAKSAEPECESLGGRDERVEGLLRGEVFRGARAAASDDDDGAGTAFVVDHGSSWGGIAGGGEAADADAESSEQKPVEAESASANEASVDDVSFADLAKALGASSGESAPAERAAAEIPQRSAPACDEAASEKTAPPVEAGGREGSWMEMPGHRWVRIDVEKGEGETERTEIDIAVAPAEADSPPAAASEARRPHTAAERAAAEKVLAKLAASRDDEPKDDFPARPARTQREKAPRGAAEREKPREERASAAESAVRETSGNDGGDPIYDLFELGAVEYVEEIQIER